MTFAKPTSYHQLAGAYELVEHAPDGVSELDPKGRLAMTINPDGLSGSYDMLYSFAGGDDEVQKATFEIDNWCMVTKVTEATRAEYVGVVAPVECRLDGKQLTFTYLDPEGVIGNLFQVWMRLD